MLAARVGIRLGHTIDWGITVERHLVEFTCRRPAAPYRDRPTERADRADGSYKCPNLVIRQSFPSRASNCPKGLYGALARGEPPCPGTRQVTFLLLLPLNLLDVLTLTVMRWSSDEGCSLPWLHELSPI